MISLQTPIAAHERRLARCDDRVPGTASRNRKDLCVRSDYSRSGFRVAVLRRPNMCGAGKLRTGKSPSLETQEVKHALVSWYAAARGPGETCFVEFAFERGQFLIDEQFQFAFQLGELTLGDREGFALRLGESIE